MASFRLREAGALDMNQVLICAVILLTFVFLFGSAMAQIKRGLTDKAPHFSFIFDSVVRELMMLAVVSLALQLIEHGTGSNIKKDWFVELEFVDLTVFCMAFVLCVKASWMLKILDKSRRTWDAACAQSYRTIRRTHADCKDKFSYGFSANHYALVLHSCPLSEFGIVYHV